MSRRAAAALVLTLGLARIAGAGDGWTPQLVADAVDGCVEPGGARPFCTCVFETLRQRYSLDDYVAFEKAAKQAGKRGSAQTAVAAEDCTRRHNATDRGTK